MKVWVWADVTPDGPAPSALELLTKARDLGDEVAAVALGPGATASAEALGEHGATTVYASDDEVFTKHLAQPAVHALAGLVEEHQPDLILFPASYDARDVAGRLQARTGSTLMANATDVLGPDKARTEILGGTKIVDVELKGPRSEARARSVHSPSRPTLRREGRGRRGQGRRPGRTEEGRAARTPRGGGVRSAAREREGRRRRRDAGSAVRTRSSSSRSSPPRSGTRRSAPRARPSTPAGCRTASRSGRRARP